MKTSKKALCILVAAAVLLAMLSACGNEASPSAQNDSQSAVASAEAPVQAEAPLDEPDPASFAEGESASAEEAVIEESIPDTVLPLTDDVVSFTGFSTFAPPLANYMSTLSDNLVYQEMAELTNVQMDFLFVSTQEAVEQFALSVASGDYPDIYSDCMSNYSGGAAQAEADEVIIDLTPYLEEFAPHYLNVINQREDLQKSAVSPEGKNLIFLTVSENVYRKGGYAIRQDWLNDLDLDTPVTYDDWHDVLTAFKNEKGADAAFFLNQGNGGDNNLSAGMGIATQVSYMPSLSVPFYQVDNVVKFGPMEDKYEDYLSMLSKWYSEGLVFADFISASAMDPDTSYVLTGRSGVWFMNSSNFDTYTEGASDENYQIVPIPDPVENEGDEELSIFLESASNSAGWVITTACEDPELLIRYIDFFYSEQGQIITNYGKEGVTYQLDEAGNPQYTDYVLNNPDGININTIVGISCLETGPFVFHAERGLQGLSQSSIDAIELWNDLPETSNSLPGVTISGENSEDYGSKINECTTYLVENVLKIITGDLPVDAYADVKENLIAMGINDCISYWQTEVDAYNG